MSPARIAPSMTHPQQTPQKQVAASGTSPLRPASTSAASLDQVTFSSRPRQWILPEDRERVLYHSADNNDLEALKDLLEYIKEGKFDINAYENRFGVRAVHRAASVGNLDWIKLAYEQGGADLQVEMFDGRTPADVARDNDKDDLARYLEDLYAKGIANPSEQKKKGGVLNFFHKAKSNRLFRACHTLVQTTIQWLLKPYHWLKERMSG